MVHILILIYFFCLVLGTWAAALTSQARRIFGYPFLRALFFSIISFNTTLFFLLLRKYFWINFPESFLSDPHSVFTIVFILAVSFAQMGWLYFFLHFSYGIVDRSISPLIKSFLLGGMVAAAVSSIIGLTAFFSGGSNRWIAMTFRCIIVSANLLLLLAIILLIIRKKTGLTRGRQESARAFGWMSLAGHLFFISFILLPEPLSLILGSAGLVVLNIIPLVWLKHYFPRHNGLLGAGPDDSALVSLVDEHGISSREREILGLLLKGMSNHDIEEHLHISYNTVKNHVYNIYRKLGVNSRWQMLGKIRDTLRLLLCVLLIPAAVVQPVLTQDSTQEKLAITHGPYLQHVTENSAVVIWFTNKNCVSHVEHGTGDNFNTFPQWGSLMVTARDVRHGLVAVDTKRHVIKIEGLEPGKSYRYRCVSKEMIQFEPYEVLFGDTIVSGIYEFETMDPGKPGTSMIFFEDIHGDAERLDGMLQKMPLDEIDMIFFNGDTVSYLTGEQSLFDGFLDVSVDRFAKEIPFLYIRGNHDTRGAFARSLENYFPPREGKYFYSFTQGPAHFIVMDSGEDKADDAPVYAGLVEFDAYREKQAEWLKQEIQTEAFKNARFKIGVFHILPIREGRHVTDHLRRLWVPLLNEGGLDILFCAHNHRFFHHEPVEGRNFPVIVGPAQGFVRVDISEEGMSVRVESTTGEVLDSFVIKARQTS